MRRIIGMAIVACLLTAGPVSAAMLTLDGPTLAGFGQTGGTAVASFCTSSGADFASFTTLWATGTSGSVQLATTSILEGWAHDQGPHTVSIGVTNRDENPWSFTFSLNGITLTQPLTNEWRLLGEGESTVFTFTFSPASQQGDMYTFELFVKGDFASRAGGSEVDRTAEYTLTSAVPTPIPAAFLLLASGLVGLGLIRRRSGK